MNRPAPNLLQAGLLPFWRHGSERLQFRIQPGLTFIFLAPVPKWPEGLYLYQTLASPVQSGPGIFFDKFKAVNLVTPRIQFKAAEKIGMGSMTYDLEKMEPVLSPENIGKHQYLQEPSTLTLRKWFKKGGHLLNGVSGVIPFKRISFAEGKLESRPGESRRRGESKLKS